MDKKIKYGFFLLTLLVVVLVSFFLISSYRKEHSRRLGTIVQKLTSRQYDAQRIDQAVKLLYASENDFRLFILTREPSRFERYSAKLGEVALLLDSLGTSSGQEAGLLDLLENKKLKTDLFIQARLLSDSLLRQLPQLVEKIRKSIREPAVTREPSRESLPPDTVPAASPETGPREKKKLFKRIIEAIRNEPAAVPGQPAPPERVIREKAVPGTGREAAADTLDTTGRDRDILWSVAMARHIEHMGKQELELLRANEQLFLELKELLMTLKQREAGFIRDRNLLLDKNARYTIRRIYLNNLWEQGLILFLTAVILYGIWRLYRNDRTLLRSKQEAERYARLKSEFVTTMSHEIRTPLHAIAAYAGELSKKPASPEQKEIIDAVKLSSGLLLAVVNNVLDYTKMEKRGAAPEPAPFSPEQVIREVTNGLQILAQKKGLSLDTELSLPEELLLTGDAFQLKQVLVNLINNAIKFTEQGHVSLKATLEKKTGPKAVLVLSIGDTGIGIPGDELPGIFEAFRQVDVRKMTGLGLKGSGLGLTIVKKIIDLHKGRIRVESTYGKGSVFHIRIPYKTMAGTAAGIPDKGNADLSRLKPLIVDNDLLGRKYLSAIFKGEGIECLTASNGQEAFQLFRDHPVNLILTDISMPVMNGVELTGKIRSLADSDKAFVPVIAVTAAILQEDINNYLKAGFNSCLAKPYTREQLIATIKDTMAGHPLNI